METTKITSKFVIGQLKKLIMKNNYVSHLSVEINNNKNGNESIIGYVNTPMSRVYKNLQTEDSITVPAGKDGQRVITKDSFAPFVKDIVSVSFKTTDVINSAIIEGIAIHWDGKNTAALIPSSNGWKNVITDETVKELPAEASIYKIISYSASDIRNISCLLIDVKKHNREEYLDSISQKAFDVYIGKEFDRIKIMKTIPRFGQLQAGSVDFGKMPNWAYYRKPFVDNKGQQVFDGTVYVLDEYIASIYSIKLKCEISPESVRGMFLQIRPGMLKCATLVVSRKVMEILNNKFKDSNYDVYGDKTDIPVMIADKNAVKEEFDFSVLPEFHVLDIAQNSVANTSKQMLEKVLAIDATKAKELIIDLSYNQMLDKVSREILDRKASILTPGQIEKGYVADIVLSIAPQYVKSNKAMFRNVTSNLIQGSVNSLDKMKFEIEGTNARLTADPAELLGLERVIKYNEVYLPHADKYMKKNKLQNLKVSMFKYPTMGLKEYYLAEALSFKEVKRRINNQNTSAENKKALIDLYASLHDGVAILPAIPEIMNQCAGLDYDYDGATFVYNVKLNDILSTTEEEIVVIVDSNQKQKSVLAQKIAEMKTVKWQFNEDAIGKAFIGLTINDNQSIGYITNVNTTQIALSMLKRVGRSEEAINALKVAFKTEGGTSKYVGFVPSSIEVDRIKRLAYDVDINQIDNIIEEIKNADLSDIVNIDKIYADLNRIYRAYQEKTIDAAKKAYEVEIKAIVEHLKAESLLSLNFSLDIDKAEFSISRAINTSRKTTSFLDLMAMVQNYIAKSYKEAIEELLKMDISMTLEEAARLESYKNEENKAVIADITNTIKYSYGAIVAQYSSKRQTALEKESDLLAIMAKEEFDNNISILSNLTRQILIGRSPEEVASIVSLVAAIDKDGTINKTSTNQMAISIAKEEFLNMVLNNYAEIKVCGYKVLIDKGLEVGQKYSFVYGQHDGSLLDFKGEEFATGEFEIIEFNNAKYAVKPIVIEVPEANLNKRSFALKNSIDISYDDLINSLTKGQSISISNDHFVYLEDIKVAEIKAEYLNKGVSSLVASKSGNISNVIYCNKNVGRATVIVEIENIKDVEISNVTDDDIASVEDYNIPQDCVAPTLDDEDFELAMVESQF